MKLLILGASGLVGGRVLDQALVNPSVTHVVAPTRTALPAHDWLSDIDSRRFSDALLDRATFAVDAVICALGTTIAKAGSKEAFRDVDYKLPMAFARAACREGAKTFALVTAIGASVDSNFFYARVKGELERDIKKIGFESLTIARPSIIGGDRPDHRAGEGVALTLSRMLSPVLPKKFHVNPADRIAKALLDSVTNAAPGCHYRYSETMT